MEIESEESSESEISGEDAFSIEELITAVGIEKRKHLTFNFDLLVSVLVIACTHRLNKVYVINFSASVQEYFKDKDDSSLMVTWR